MAAAEVAVDVADGVAVGAVGCAEVIAANGNAASATNVLRPSKLLAKNR